MITERNLEVTPVDFPAEADVAEYNSRAWDAQVAAGNKWTVPADAETIARARRGEFQVLLTPTRSVPADWFPPLAGANVLCLASGGGQQGPVLAAAGANVTVVDRSAKQLGQDQLVAQREQLALRTLQTDMRDLSALADASFDLIVHPCSNCFCPEIRPVWREAARVTKPGGVLLVGFTNPLRFMFDERAMTEGRLEVRYKVPYADIRDLPPDELRYFTDRDEPLLFGHTLEDQIGAQLAAGFVLEGLFEDTYEEGANDLLSKYIASFIATRAVRRSWP